MLVSKGDEKRSVRICRTLLEAATIQDYYQQQFLIIDRDLDGVEDIF